MICTCCGAYYRRSAYNNSMECSDCCAVVPAAYDADYEADIQQLVNPIGKTKAVYIDDTDVDSFSS